MLTGFPVLGKSYANLALAAGSVAWMRPEDLIGFKEIVQMLGVAQRTAARYVKRSDFPPPYVRLAAGPIWLRRDVEKWARSRLPLPEGRPKRPPSR
jgi:predicted DNA-binding transcriptional regulator AlpA